MAVDYETIISTDLSGLSKAASAWKKMGDRFGELHDNYRDHVKAAVESDNWQGQSALSYRGQAKVTLEEYAGARDEARAVGKLLKEAYTTLKSRRQRVLDIRNEAEQAGMDVGAHGRCTLNLSKLEGKQEAEIYRHNTLARQEAEESWTAKVAKAVKDVQDADSNIAKALMANPDDGGKGLRDGFNGALKGDVGEANAERASELYQKIKKGGKLSAKESEELTLLMGQNERDQEFSRTLINSLGGADGVITMHNELTDRAYYDESGQRKHYLTLDKNLANVVATATTVDKKDTAADKKFYDKWRKQMQEVGLRKYDAEVVGGEYGGQQVRGYQALVTLMRNGSGYDEEFLHDLADDIRAAEDPKKGGDPDIWDLDGNFAGKQNEDGTFSRSGRGWFANDPYDGVLGIMSKNPDTATAYFDPDTAEGKDRLKYLQEDRDWRVVNRHEWGGNANTVHAEEDIDSRTGFGAALEAAMTGHVPGAEPDTDKPTHHSRAQVRVLEEVVRSYAEAASIDTTAIPENIRKNMANALAYYPNDVQDILGMNTDYSEKHASTDPNDVNLDGENLRRFIRGVAEDGGAFRTIHDSQMRIITQDISVLSREDFENGTERAQLVAQVSGKTMGSLDYVRADVLASHRDDQISQNNWNKSYKYHILGAPVTNIPVVGDVLQRLVDIGTGKELDRLNEEVSNKTKQELIEYYSDEGYPRLRRAMQERAFEVGLTDGYVEDKERGIFNLVIMSTAENNYNNGIGASRGSTGKAP